MCQIDHIAAILVLAAYQLASFPGTADEGVTDRARPFRFPAQMAISGAAVGYWDLAVTADGGALFAARIGGDIDEFQPLQGASPGRTRFVPTPRPGEQARRRLPVSAYRGQALLVAVPDPADPVETSQILLFNQDQKGVAGGFKRVGTATEGQIHRLAFIPVDAGNQAGFIVAALSDGRPPFIVAETGRPVATPPLHYQGAIGYCPNDRSCDGTSVTGIVKDGQTQIFAGGYWGLLHLEIASAQSTRADYRGEIPPSAIKEAVFGTDDDCAPDVVVASLAVHPDGKYLAVGYRVNEENRGASPACLDTGEERTDECERQRPGVLLYKIESGKLAGEPAYRLRVRGAQSTERCDVGEVAFSADGCSLFAAGYAWMPFEEESIRDAIPILRVFPPYAVAIFRWDMVPHEDTCTATGIDEQAAPIAYPAGLDRIQRIIPYVAIQNAGSRYAAGFVTQDGTAGLVAQERKLVTSSIMFLNTDAPDDFRQFSLDLTETSDLPLWASSDGSRLFLRPIRKDQAAFAFDLDALTLDEPLTSFPQNGGMVVPDLAFAKIGGLNADFATLSVRVRERALLGSECYKHVRAWIEEDRDPFHRKHAIRFEQGTEQLNAIDFHPASNRFVVGTSHRLYVRHCGTDDAEKTPWKTDLSAEALRLNFTSNGRWIVVAHRDGVIRWYDADADLKHALSLLVLKSSAAAPEGKLQWILWAQDGTWAASSAAAATTVKWVTYPDYSPENDRWFAIPTDLASLPSFESPQDLRDILEKANAEARPSEVIIMGEGLGESAAQYVERRSACALAPDAVSILRIDASADTGSVAGELQIVDRCAREGSINDFIILIDLGEETYDITGDLSDVKQVAGNPITYRAGFSIAAERLTPGQLSYRVAPRARLVPRRFPETVGRPRALNIAASDAGARTVALYSKSSDSFDRNARGRVFLFAVGATQYTELSPLTYTVGDVELMEAFWTQQRIYDPQEKDWVILKDSHVNPITEKMMRDQLEAFRNRLRVVSPPVNRNDLVVVFFAGHAGLERQQAFKGMYSGMTLHLPTPPDQTDVLNGNDDNDGRLQLSDAVNVVYSSDQVRLHASVWFVIDACRTPGQSVAYIPRSDDYSVLPEDLLFYATGFGESAFEADEAFFEGLEHNQAFYGKFGEYRVPKNEVVGNGLFTRSLIATLEDFATAKERKDFGDLAKDVGDRASAYLREFLKRPGLNFTPDEVANYAPVMYSPRDKFQHGQVFRRVKGVPGSGR